MYLHNMSAETLGKDMSTNKQIITNYQIDSILTHRRCMTKINKARHGADIGSGRYKNIISIKLKLESNNSLATMLR